MDARTHLLIVKHTAKLEKLIRENASPEKILKQSKILDKYLFIQFKYINKIGVSS